MDNYRIAISDACEGMQGVFPGADIVNIRQGAQLSNYFGQMHSEYFVLILKPIARLGDNIADIIRKCAGMAYCSLSEYTPGSVRDDFDLGSAVVINGAAARGAAMSVCKDTQLAGFYDFRLQLSRLAPIERAEPFYVNKEANAEDSEKAQFAYCHPRNRVYQAEAERVFTKYLEQAGAIVKPVLEDVADFDSIAASYPLAASVIIPVKDRPQVIADAIKSAATQKTDFEFNVLVVDNQSQEATRAILGRCASIYPNVRVIETTEPGIGIGGCWNIAIMSQYCGAIAIQLDSDDVYSSPNALQAIVDAFRREKCGLLIGSYRLTDISLNPISDIIIDHREYTQANGVNNALRVNGFGAPRCYLAELVRRNPFRNVSYGEDYDLCLRLSRQYKLSRIYDVLYLCRRWGSNSDSNLTPERLAELNLLKDGFRADELAIRSGAIANLT